jgi:hypothetical protein
MLDSGSEFLLLLFLRLLPVSDSFTTMGGRYGGHMVNSALVVDDRLKCKAPAIECKVYFFIVPIFLQCSMGEDVAVGGYSIAWPCGASPCTIDFHGGRVELRVGNFGPFFFHAGVLAKVVGAEAEQGDLASTGGVPAAKAWETWADSKLGGLPRPIGLAFCKDMCCHFGLVILEAFLLCASATNREIYLSVRKRRRCRLNLAKRFTCQAGVVKTKGLRPPGFHDAAA